MKLKFLFFVFSFLFITSLTLFFLAKISPISAATNNYLYLNGKVGIGTSTPAFPLDVNGIINSTGLYVNGSPYIGSQWTTSGSNIYYNGGNVGIGTANPTYNLDVSGSNGNFRLQKSGSTSNIQMRGGSDGGSSSSLYMYNPSGTLSTDITDGTYPSFFSGNVGIGTNNTLNPLTVVSNTAGLFAAYFNNTAANGSGIAVNGKSYINNGNFGIGTTNPTHLLEVGNGQSTAYELFNGTNSKTLALFNGSSGYNPYISSSTDLRIQPQNTGNTILNENGGSVEIGNKTPSYPLEVDTSSTGWTVGINNNIGNLNPDGLWAYGTNVAIQGYGIGNSSIGVQGYGNIAVQGNGSGSSSIGVQGNGGQGCYGYVGYEAESFAGNCASGTLGGWYNSSSKSIKENFTNIDLSQILSKINSLPIMEWDFKPSVTPDGGSNLKHIGPFAEDFQALFGLNGSDTVNINSIDEMGVTLAGVKALSQKSDQQQQEIDDLKIQNQNLKSEISALKAQNQQIESRLSVLSK